MDIDGIVIGFRFHSHIFIHELDAGEYLARIGEEFIQQIEFLLGRVWLLLSLVTVRES